MNKEQYGKSIYKLEVENAARACQSLRMDTDSPVDISLSTYVKKRWGVSMDSFYEDLGIDPFLDTIANITTMPDASIRWLLPEIFLEAIRLGLRRSPIWPNIIAAEQTVRQPVVNLPWWNMSDATPGLLNEGETIGIGDISFSQKQMKLRKMGRGIKIPYEVNQYVAVNVVGIYLQDFGIKLGQGLDTLLISTLINGEQANGSESAPVVGITTPNSLVYVDILKVWIRMGRIGRQPQCIIGGEDSAITVLNLPEFKNRQNPYAPYKILEMKTPIPTNADFYVHGAVPSSQLIIIDKGASVVKFNAQPLLVESEKIIANQTQETFATLTTGFGIIYRDARVVIDQSLSFAANGFPDYMNVDSVETVIID